MDGLVISAPMAEEIAAIFTRIARVNRVLDRVEKILDESDRANGRTQAVCSRGG